MQEIFDSYKIATALRMARAAVGWSQVELAAHLGMAKTTLARAETVDGSLRSGQLTQIMRLYQTMGVEMDFYSGDMVRVKIDRKGLELGLDRLRDEALRRRDRKKTGVFITARRVRNSGPTFE